MDIPSGHRSEDGAAHDELIAFRPGADRSRRSPTVPSKASGPGSRGKKENEAKRRLEAPLKEIHGDRFVGPQEERLTVQELADNLILHLKTKGAKAVSSFDSHLKPVREHFALIRATDLTTAMIERFIQQRKSDGNANATINHEVGALHQATEPRPEARRLSRVPYIPRLKEDNARQRFFERAEFEAVVAHLPDPVNDIARFGYLTGWRKGRSCPTMGGGRSDRPRDQAAHELKQISSSRIS